MGSTMRVARRPPSRHGRHLPGSCRLRRGTTHVRRRPMPRLIRTTGPRTGNQSHSCHVAPGVRAPSHPWRRGLLWAGAVAGLAFGGYALAPTVKTMMETVSTDDAYVNGHVTYVAPRVAGQVSRVLVDDNDRVKQGGPAGPARQGAVPGPGRPQEGGRRQRGGRRGGRAGPGPGHPGPGPEPALEAPEGDRGRRRQGRAAQGPGRGPAEQGGDPRPRQGRLRPGPAALQPGARSPARSSTSAARPCGRPRPRSSRPSKRSMRRGSPSASPRTPRGRT